MWWCSWPRPSSSRAGPSASITWPYSAAWRSAAGSGAMSPIWPASMPDSMPPRPAWWRAWPSIGRRPGCRIPSRKDRRHDPLLHGRQLGDIPAAAQRLDQADAGCRALTEDAEAGLLAAERRGLGGDDGGVVDRPRLVLIEGEARRLFRRPHGGGLHPGFLFEDSQRRQLVLDLLEGGQHGLPIEGDLLVIGAMGRFQLGRAQAAFEQRFR